jgi:hypothetical protein
MAPKMVVKADVQQAAHEKPPFDPIMQARSLAKEDKNQGTAVFENAGAIFDNIAPALEAGRCSLLALCHPA